ncbi:Hypothetical protein FKW44_005881 [Caligus rogercresseyi]|uniref:Uncharacterized protein n=1 Tax=Caligus rogercresseyi TaxID=217165 RepID=A0A7T8KCK6_CALRO|nr:Hypothetical protein FKW44_005881 [Caligus rogercresseyi]
MGPRVPPNTIIIFLGYKFPANGRLIPPNTIELFLGYKSSANGRLERFVCLFEGRIQEYELKSSLESRAESNLRS